MHPLLAAVLIWEGSIQAREMIERRTVYNQAAEAADAFGVPLIVVGCPKYQSLQHGYGDGVLDIQHRLYCTCPNPITADLQEIDGIFEPKSIVVFSSHVLEHLTVEQGERAMVAVERVAIARFHVWPSRFSISGWLAPEHVSWPVEISPGEMAFEERIR